MSQFDDLLSQIPLSQLASQVGADEGEVEQAVRQALPALLGGMKVNAQDPQGAESLASAVRQHESDQFFAGGVNLDQVDAEDGQKIVGHVFGGNTDAVVNQLGGLGGGTGGDLVKKLLPMLAPIVLAWLAKQFGGQLGGATAGAQADPQAGGGNILGDLLGGVLGGAGGGGQAGGLDDLLGSILKGR